jgi:prepilin-type N-terminal cleavage/methylation domain-containing protein
MLSTIRKRKEGFTIIEVMIVLAIAGLILLIVFLAVPALQRSARNTQRKNDVSSLLSALSEYTDNNNGTLPATCAGAACFGAATWGSNAKLGFYATANVNFTNEAAAAAPAAVTNINNVNIYNYSVCNGEVASASAATPRSVIALYALEIGGSTGYMSQCIESGV